MILSEALTLLAPAAAFFPALRASQRVPWIKVDNVAELDLIISDPAVMMGKPVIAGTRITVEYVLQHLAAGETTQQLLAAHSRLTDKGIRAALEYAGEVLRNNIVFPVSPVRQ